MKTKFLFWLLLTGAFFMTQQCRSQNRIDWQAFNASGAGTCILGSEQLYSSFGQPAVGVSTSSGMVLHSGYLFIRLVPSGAPTIITQSAVDFGNVIVGQTVMKSLTVQNGGSAPLIISSMTITPSVYTIISGGGPQTISSGGSITMQLQFRPTSAGSITGTLTIQSNASNNPTFPVTLSGTGNATAPVIQLSTLALDFGVVAVTSSTIRSVTVTNTGNAPLNIISQNIGGTSAGEFVVTHPSGSTIAAGANDYIEIRFSPASAGVKSAQLSISSNDANNPLMVVTLSGSGTTGTVPHITVSTSLMDFGTTAPGIAVTRDLVISNTGNAQLILSSQTVSGSTFTLQSSGSSPVAPGSSTTAQVRFTPSVQGTYTGTFEIVSNDPALPTTTVNLRGVCSTVSGPRISLARTVIDFGQVPLLTPKEEDLVIGNIGTTDLTISQQSITGTDAIHYSITQAAASPIAPGGSSTVRIRHYPTSAGSKVAMLRLQTNDPGLPVTDIVLVSIVVSIERLPIAPSGIQLHQNYPNPFNPSTTIEYEIDRRGSVELILYNAYGEQVAGLDKALREPGTYRVVFQADRMATGTYSVVLRVSDQNGSIHSRTIQMVMIK